MQVGVIRGPRINDRRSMNDTDFRRVRGAMLRQGEGDRVPLFEISIHQAIKAQILGRPVRAPQDEVEFWRTAGYDFVCIRSGVRSVVRGLHPVVREWLLRCTIGEIRRKQERQLGQ